MDKICSKNMVVTLPGRQSKNNLTTIKKECNDLVAVYTGDTHLFCTRKDGSKFNFRSIKSLGKLFPGINPADLQVVTYWRRPCSRNPFN
jgi:hypothetical protein